MTDSRESQSCSTAADSSPKGHDVPKGPSVKATEVGSVFVSNYPPFSFWNDAGLPEYMDALQESPEAAAPLGLYMHIPFCRKRCKFCYFRVYVDKNAEETQSYLDSLAREVELYSRYPAIAERPVKFVYFGGGTPSYVAVKHMKELVTRVQKAMPWDQVEEVTFECEPGTLTEPKVKYYREMGVTRLSLGVENWNETILRENGRAHEVKEIHRCLPWIRAAGFDQLNMDLIAGMVGETWETWKDSVQKTIDMDPDSVTIYQMELPFNTVYSRGILEEGKSSPVADWQTKREWNQYAIEEMCAAGYEISSAYTLVKSASKKGDQGRFVYRDALWHGSDMLGTGIASFGHMGGVHAQNVASWHDYLGAVADGRLPLGRAFPTSEKERLTRELILQMKLGRLDFDYFRDKFGVDPHASWKSVWDKLKAEDMVAEVGEDGMELTRRGLLQVDTLLPNFYDGTYQNARYT